MELTWEGEPPHYERSSNVPQTIVSVPRVDSGTATCREKHASPHHGLLQVGADASQAELREAFRQRALEAASCKGGKCLGPCLGELAAAFEALVGEDHRLRAAGVPDNPLTVTAAQALSRPAKVVKWMAQLSLLPSFASPQAAASEFLATVHPMSRSKKANTTRFYSRLHGLLRRLDPEQRRSVIAQQLTQEQRLVLERWMLQHAPRSSHGNKSSCAGVCMPRFHGGTPLKPLPGTGPRRASGNYIWPCDGGRGYCAGIHFGHLYAQSARCRDLVSAIQALQVLLTLRARCRVHVAADAGRGLDWVEVFRGGVTAAVRDMQRFGGDAGEAVPRLYFRSRVALGRGLPKLSTPLRRDACDALRDWRCLVGACAEPGLSREAAAAQWEALTSAWLSVWRERGGMSQKELRARLAAKEAVHRAAAEDAARRLERSQTSVTKQINGLLGKRAQHEDPPGAERARGRRL